MMVNVVCKRNRSNKQEQCSAKEFSSVAQTLSVCEYKSLSYLEREKKPFIFMLNTVQDFTSLCSTHSSVHEKKM